VDIAAALGLAALLFVKEMGVPIPIPGDLLVIGAGVASAGNPAGALVTLVVILLAGYVGGLIQFLLAKGALRRPLISLLTRFGVSRERIDALADRLRRGGTRGVAVARATPGVRVPAIAASGIAALPTSDFAPGLVLGNTLFVGAHFLLGFIVGVPAVAFVQSAGATLAVGALVLFAVIGAIGWLAIRRRRRQQAEGALTFGAWADACCPACLAVALVGGDESGRGVPG
jgi:membrane protein DedA with SNARE-associated domain